MARCGQGMQMFEQMAHLCKDIPVNCYPCPSHIYEELWSNETDSYHISFLFLKKLIHILGILFRRAQNSF